MERLIYTICVISALIGVWLFINDLMLMIRFIFPPPKDEDDKYPHLK